MSTPWYPWYPQDFRGDPKVALLNWRARAAYRELLDLSWGVGPIPDPVAALRAVGIPARLWDAVRPCWTEGPDGWVQKRLEIERNLADQRIERARAAGKASARRRAELKFNARSTGDESESSTCNNSRATNHNHTNSNTHKVPPTEGADPTDRCAPETEIPNGNPTKPARAREGTVKRKPTEEDVRAAIGEYVALQALPGFESACLAWREELGSKKCWASVAALHRHLRWLEKRPDDALELVQIAAENRWTDPSHAERVLRNARAAPQAASPTGHAQASKVYRCPDHLRKP